MTTIEALRHFLRAHQGDRVLSVYLEARASDPAERHQRALRLRHHLTEARVTLADAPHAERIAFERAADSILARVPGDAAVEAGGSWACFAAEDGDILELVLPPGVETSAHWDRGPRVVPAVRVAEAEAALIAQADFDRVRLTRWNGGRFETLLALEATPSTAPEAHLGSPPKPGFHAGTRGGTATDDAQRHRHEERERLLASLVKKLTAVPGAALPLVLGGGATTVSHLRKLLPPAIDERAELSEALHMEPPHAALPVIRAALKRLRQRALAKRVAALRGTALAHGRAVIGVERAALAAANGAIADLLCTDHAWHAHPDAVEAVVKRSMLDGALVQWVDVPALDGTTELEHEGMVAGLRFALVGV